MWLLFNYIFKNSTSLEPSQYYDAAKKNNTTLTLLIMTWCPMFLHYSTSLKVILVFEIAFAFDLFRAPVNFGLIDKTGTAVLFYFLL